MAIKGKKKGNKYELAACELLRIYGWEAKTSRLASRELDNLGVDIVTNAPFNIQCKAVERLSPGYHEILASMPRDKTPVIFHKRNNKGSVVVMELKDFAELLLSAAQIIKEHPIYDNKRTNSTPGGASRD